MRRPFIERPMKPLLIIKLEIVVQTTPSRVNRVIRMKIDMFIFHCPPETFNENVIKHSACSSPTDTNVSRFKPSGKGIRRELGTLIAIHSLDRTLGLK